ncbi:phosphate ABC transporter substrate-binding protein [Ideonella livida]|uniref:Phosphate ABC transporter substrate-binding protein n=1 Tax=Ideonella livida TaxID=2707176 RepID=A0A7C9PKZ0_9BURK|nr:phosphate ABC transporter substrate-binding protein [Ideonella livida]NDY94010.1 phosphate ABC transporter substrate-binding protein [Ideonella livida]
MRPLLTDATCHRRAALLGLLVAGLGTALPPATARAEEPNPVVIAHRGVPVQQLDGDGVTRLFLKQSTQWPDGRPAEPVDLREGHALRAAFYARVAGRTPAQVRAYWARQSFTGMALPPRQLTTPEEVERYVASTPGAVGYVARRPVSPQVKVIHDSAE